MAEKSNEQLVRLLIGAAFHEGTLEHRDSPSYATLQKARNAVETAQAAVLARMAGPGEVVVPRERIEEWKAAVESWGAYASDYFKDKWDFAADVASFDPYLPARPQGGNDDQTK